MKNLSESIMKNLKESADNDRIVKVRVDYADDSIELTEENIKKEIKKYLPNARIAVIHSKNGRWPEVEITDKYNDLKSYISDIYLGGFDEDQNIDDFLVESVSRNLSTKSRRKAKKLNESSILDVDGSSDLNDIMESDEVMYIINVYDNADIDVGQIIHDYTSNLMRLDIDAVKKALSDWASDIREHMGDM